MKSDKNTITIKDVAQLAEVSTATVSKVMNGSSRISTETIERVNQAIEKLNYRPNSIARSLRQNKTRTIGLLNNSKSNKNTFVLQLMVGVEEEARAHGFSTFLCNSAASQAQEKEYLDMLLDKQVDGLIFLNNVVKNRALPDAVLGNTPFVFLNQYSSQPGYPSVIPDDYQGALTATEHLIKLGHTRVAFVNGRLKHEACAHRLRGYKDALNKAGLEPDSSLIEGQDTWNEEGGYKSAKRLLSLAQPPTAIFCANDSLAIGVLDSFKELGIAVPQDISLIGFDNSLAGQQKRPPLTSIALPFAEMGKLAVDLLVASLKGKEINQSIHYVACPLVKRESCDVQLRAASY